MLLRPELLTLLSLRLDSHPTYPPTPSSSSSSSLRREVIDTERIEVADSLQKAEIKAAELELEISRLKTEEAGLRDALLKMQALNEGLGQDKIELNKLVAAVSLMVTEKDRATDRQRDRQTDSSPPQGKKTKNWLCLSMGILFFVNYLPYLEVKEW